MGRERKYASLCTSPGQEPEQGSMPRPHKPSDTAGLSAASVSARLRRMNCSVFKPSSSAGLIRHAGHDVACPGRPAMRSLGGLQGYLPSEPFSVMQLGTSNTRHIKKAISLTGSDRNLLARSCILFLSGMVTVQIFAAKPEGNWVCRCGATA